ncbi:hypothetical protein ACFL6N_02885 [Thermodesulfobacteriota bacterium]
MTWLEFLKELKEAVNSLEKRMEKALRDPSRNPFPVVFHPGKIQSKSEEICIGIGAWYTKNDNGQWTKVNHEGICLNNKMGAKEYLNLEQEISSVTDLVILSANAANANMRNGWQTSLNKISSLEDFFDQFTLIVEDASPDSCFSLISYLATMVCRLPIAEIPQMWVDYVRRWEMGDVRTTGEPFSSWGTQHSALAHGRFERAAFKKEGPNPVADLSMSRAWIDCLRFDIATILIGASPHDLTTVAVYPELLTAKAFLNYEYQQYIQSLQHATTLQLLLPMDETGERCKLVDAIIETEYISLGAQKCFIRNDSEHTWLHDGFALMAVYKPSEAGTGNDMTISLDPATGVHLKDLWTRLEALENERWNGQRPCDNPRIGIAGYPEGKMKDGSPAPNQPWYDENPRFTLVAAPKNIETSDGVISGTKLEWKDVVNVLWELYNPVGKLLFKSSNQNSCKLHECAGSFNDVESANRTKKFLIAHWIKEETGIQSIPLSPTVKRYFAACVAQSSICYDVFSFSDLPVESSFDFLSIQGGFVLVHEKGAFLFDDWRPEDPDESGFQKEFDSVLKRFEVVQRVQQELSDIVQTVDIQLTKSGGKISNEVKLLQRLISLKLDMRQTLTSTMPISSTMKLQHFRECLELRWGIGRRLEDFYDAAAQLEQTLRDYSELQTNRTISLLTIYGFPLVFFAGFFQFIFQNIPKTISFGDFTWAPELFGIHLIGSVCYFLTTLFAILCLRYFVNRNKFSKQKIV